MAPAVSRSRAAKSSHNTIRIFLYALGMFAVLFAVQHVAAFSSRDGGNVDVDPHVLFENLVRAVIHAGDAISHNGSATLTSQAQYADGTSDLHIAADATASRSFQRLVTSMPALTFIDEERLGSLSAPLRPTRAHRTTGLAGTRFRRHNAMLEALQKEMLPSEELAVYIDPLDGSTDLANGHPEFVSVSACITRCGRAVAGIIYQPSTKRLYWTRPGAGVNVHFDADTAITAERGVPSAWNVQAASAEGTCCAPPAAMAQQRKNTGIQATVKQEDTIVGSQIPALIGNSLKLLMSKSHSAKSEVTGVAAYLTDKLKDSPQPLSIEVVPVGGAGFKAVELLEGRAHAYAHSSDIRKWDVCAGQALLEALQSPHAQAGRPMWTTYHGEQLDYCVRSRKPDLKELTIDGVLAATSKAVHQFVLQGVKGTDKAS